MLFTSINKYECKKKTIGIKLVIFLRGKTHYIYLVLVLSQQKKPIIYLQLPEILKSIVLLQMRNEMPCFECDNVIFITNKWDTIFSEYDSSEEDEETKTWKKLQSEIKERWPLVKEENIFKLNLKDVHVSINTIKNFLPYNLDCVSL